jgi:hypothetical protein
LNTKVAINELSFPLVTHTAYSDTRFDSYGILKSGHGADNILDRLSLPQTTKYGHQQQNKINTLKITTYIR